MLTADEKGIVRKIIVQGGVNAIQQTAQAGRPFQPQVAGAAIEQAMIDMASKGDEEVRAIILLWKSAQNKGIDDAIAKEQARIVELQAQKAVLNPPSGN